MESLRFPMTVDQFMFLFCRPHSPSHSPLRSERISSRQNVAGSKPFPRIGFRSGWGLRSPGGMLCSRTMTCVEVKPWNILLYAWFKAGNAQFF